MSKRRPFADVEFISWDTCPKWIKDGKKFLEKELPICSHYAPNCIVCETWIDFMRIAQLFEDIDKAPKKRKI
jgi:hypothetical protein